MYWGQGISIFGENETFIETIIETIIGSLLSQIMNSFISLNLI